MESNVIAKIYADLVQAGRRQLEDVPEPVREQVKKILGADQDD